MSNNTVVIEVNNLSKAYKIGLKEQRSETFVAALLQGIRKPLNNFKKLTSLKNVLEDESDTFWALTDVSFSLKKGEVLGVIGKNGAGKSTLLKLLSRITFATSGSIKCKGKVASLLEVGTGFNPELTGRENVYLNGTILGLTKKEIDKRFDEIVAFSGIEQFIDTPAKRYSSGMKVRLAFAVAAHLEPDILIIDEVLAVGDAEFQRKCLGKMQEISGQDGRTVLFVSHNMAAVKNLCTRGIVLQNGKLVFDGTQIEAVNYYQRNIDTSHMVDYGHEIDNAPGNEFVKILGCKVAPKNGDNITIDSGIEFELLIYNFLENANLDVTFDLRNTDEVNVFHNGVVITNNYNSKKGYYTIKGELQANTINGGIYFFTVFIGQDTSKLLFKLKDFVQFEVIYENKGSFIKSTPGVMYPAIPFSITYKDV